MAPKKPAKRVAKAGPNVKGGKFKGKDSINLSKKELGKKGSAAASKRTVDIGKTKHKKEGPHKGKVVGPKGNPLTGKVDMGGGNMAVYKDGKRVTARTAGGGGGGGGGGGKTAAQIAAEKRAKIAAEKRAKIAKEGKAASKKGSTTTTANLNAKVKAKAKGDGSAKLYSSANKNPEEGNKSGTKTGTGKKWYEQGGGGLAGPNSPIKGPKKPKEGSTYIGRNGNKYVYKSGKWVKQ
jgi:hypothetical protein